MNKRLMIVVVTASVIIPGCRLGEDQPVVAPSTGTEFSPRVGSALPVAELPNHVVAPPEELTLYADYSDVRGNQVVLYLVNRTGKNLLLAGQDGDVYVKLEANQHGVWERAQTHVYSMCGNSSAQFKLPPDRFFRFLGQYPCTGTMTLVRYQLYGDTITAIDDEEAQALPDGVPLWNRPPISERLEVELVSNMGLGRIPLGAVQSSRSDAMAARLGSFEIAAEIARGERVVQSLWPPSGHRQTAVESLSRFTDDRCVNLLRELAGDSDPQVYCPALNTLAKIAHHNPVAGQVVVSMLRSEDLGVHCAAMQAVSQLPASFNPKSTLEQQLHDAEPMVRLAGLYALFALASDDEHVVELARIMLEDPDDDVCTGAANLLRYRSLRTPQASLQGG